MSSRMHMSSSSQPTHQLAARHVCTTAVSLIVVSYTEFAVVMVDLRE